jgi:FtsZ-binding cell division protein ZapB
MRLLDPRTLKTVAEKERDIEVKQLHERRATIIAEITKFNHQRDVLVKSKALLEEDFDKFCETINNKRRVLQAEIKELENKKDSINKQYGT